MDTGGPFLENLSLYASEPLHFWQIWDWTESNPDPKPDRDDYYDFRGQKSAKRPPRGQRRRRRQRARAGRRPAVVRQPVGVGRPSAHPSDRLLAARSPMPSAFRGSAGFVHTGTWAPARGSCLHQAPEPPRLRPLWPGAAARAPYRWTWPKKPRVARVPRARTLPNRTSTWCGSSFPDLARAHGRVRSPLAAHSTRLGQGYPALCSAWPGSAGFRIPSRFAAPTWPAQHRASRPILGLLTSDDNSDPSLALGQSGARA